MVGDQADRENVVGSRLDSFLNFDGFVAIFFQLDVTCSGVGKWDGNRRIPNGLVVDGNKCAFRVTPNDKSSLNATGIEQKQTDQEAEAQAGS